MNVPALKEKWVGGKTYESLVDHLSKHDLGLTFNSEWEKRVKKFIQYLVKHDNCIHMLLRKYNNEGR
jgi:hypothetical protein